MWKELNDQVKCTLRPSKIHGIGVFAIRDIPKGERMHCRGLGMAYRWCELKPEEFKQVRPEVKEIILARWPIALKGERFIHPHSDAWLLSFMNHSKTPNYDKLNDIALVDIKKDEEVTEDYGEEFVFTLNS